MPGPIPADARDAIEAELLEPQTPPRSRAAIAKEHGVSTRTVSRIEEGLGLPKGDTFRTDSIRAATQAATDRRRDLRSKLADRLLELEVPRILEQLEDATEQWRKTVILGSPEGDETRRVVEDDATIARGVKDLHAALNTALRATIDIDKTDVADGDQAARQTLEHLFGGLSAVYDRIRGRRDPAPDDGDAMLDEEMP